MVLNCSAVRISQLKCVILSGKDHVLVGRVRNDISHHSGINLWVVADNVRKGAATNAVQIAELLVRDYF